MPGTPEQAAFRVRLTMCHNEHVNIKRKTILLASPERQEFLGKARKL